MQEKAYNGCVTNACIIYQWEGKFQIGAHVDWPWFTLVSNAYLRAEGWSIKMIITAVALATRNGQKYCKIMYR